VTLANERLRRPIPLSFYHLFTHLSRRFERRACAAKPGSLRGTPSTPLFPIQGRADWANAPHRQREEGILGGHPHTPRPAAQAQRRAPGPGAPSLLLGVGQAVGVVVHAGEGGQGGFELGGEQRIRRIYGLPPLARRLIR